MTTAYETTPAELLDLARGLLRETDSGTTGLWPRAAAYLGRQALELALDDYWERSVPGIGEAPARAQLICLGAYLDDEELAERISHVWWVFTRAGHHHPYELAPTGQELEEWLEELGEILASLAAREVGPEQQSARAEP